MAYNGLSTISGSDSRFSYLPTSSISSIKSLKSSSVRFPSRPPSFKLRAMAAAEPFSSGMSFYELLGIPESGSLPEIKNAYRQLARKYHPDVSPLDRVNEFTKMFIRLREAYETLSDPGRRALYDRALHLGYSNGGSSYDDQMREIKKGWRVIWEAQLSELMNRTYKYGDRSESWAAQIRRNRNETFTEIYN